MKLKIAITAVVAGITFICAVLIGNAGSPVESDCHVSKFETHLESYLEACTRLLERDDLSKEERAEAIYLRALWYKKHRRYEEAEAGVRRVLSMFPDHVRATNQLGDIIFDRTRDYERARKWIMRSIELDPKRPYAYGSLGYLERAVGRNKEAIQALTHAISLKPNYGWARHKRALVLRSMKHWDGMLTDTGYLATKSNKIELLGPVDYFQRQIDMRFHAAIMHGNALRAKNEFKKAEAWFAALVVDYPNQIAFTERSKFYSGLPIGRGMLSRAREALADVNEAIRLDPSFAAAYRHKAHLLRVDFNRPREAFQLLEKAIQLRRVDFRSPYLIWEKALCLRKLGQRVDAEKHGMKAIYKSAQIGSPFAYYYLQRLTQYGYYVEPTDPDYQAQAVRDAVTACMYDERCQ